MLKSEDPENWAIPETSYFKMVTGPIKRDELGNINKSLDDIVGTTLDVEKMFGPDIAQASLDKSGQVNYMKLYDVLAERQKSDPTDKSVPKLERVLDAFNRYRQYKIETESINAAREELLAQAQDLKRVGEVFTRSKGKSNPKMSSIVWEWQISLERALSEIFGEIEKLEAKRSRAGKISPKLKKGFAGGLQPYSEILFKLGTQDLAMILALEMATFSLKESRRNVVDGKGTGRFYLTARVVQALGKCVEDAYTVAVAKEQRIEMNERIVKEETKGAFNRSEETEIARRISLLSKPSLTSQANVRYWAVGKAEKMTTHDRVHLGTHLLTIILENCVIASDKATGANVPAFWHTYELQNAKYVGVIKLNESLVTKISRSDIDTSSIVLARTPPMLVKPRPWTSSTDGGYWYTKQSLLTTKPDNAPEQHAYLRAATDGHYMDDYLTCLDDLSQCAWSVNRRMLETILEIWSQGEEYLGIPPLVRGQDPHDLTSSIDYKKLDRSEFNHMTERIGLGYILRTAEVFASHGERFYFPYKIDFRGRVYPLSNSGFWHLGTDHVRSLFQFWYGKPLGVHGLKWLKIQLANMYGVDKISNDERAAFVDQHWAEIVDSADRPLEGARWWAQGDKPFQTLAACLEVVAAVRSGNPELYVSRLPVSQDGSCNGLQHYAALGRDIEGAEQVNLVTLGEGTQGPQDVYSKVRSLVEASIRQQAALKPGDRGYNEGTSAMAQKLSNKITRKVVKQPVMTSVYGVTQFGIVEQVIDKLKADPELEHAQLIYYGIYIARHIKTAIRTLFSNAHEIQDWLAECADRICESVRWDVYGDESLVSSRDFLKKFVNVVKWTTPLGLPVVQPYRKSPLMLIRTGLQTIALQNPYELSFSNRQKQRNGIAPNYIHGLDSTHLLMTAHACVAQEGLTFAAVHDSFWTHASSVETMNRVLREQFVSLHEQDLIASLRSEFQTRYAGYMQCVYIAEESAAGREINRLRASYFYSSTASTDSDVGLSTFKVNARDATLVLRHELGEEYNRWKLVNSEVEEERQQGLRIVTPSTIIDKYGEPTVWKISNRGTQFRPYTEHFKSQGTADADLEQELDELDEVDLEPGERSSAGSTKWLRVFVPLKIPNIPPRGGLDIKRVLSSEYFFS